MEELIKIIKTLSPEEVELNDYIDSIKDCPVCNGSGKRIEV